MFRDLSQANNVQFFTLNEAGIAPGQSTDIFTIDVATDEVVQVVFDYTIHDRRSRNSKVGSIQVMANGRVSIPDPVPNAHVTTEGYGDNADQMNVDVRSPGNQIIFQGVNTYSQQEPIFVSAQIRVNHIPLFAPPRIRLTITGMTGGQNFNGLGNGVHILTPISYYRSPYGGSAYSEIPYTTGLPQSFTFSTGTQCEFWNMDTGAKSLSPYAGNMKFGRDQGNPLSIGQVEWHNGATVIFTNLTFTTGVTGFAKDRVLSGSITDGTVTLAWEREPTDPPYRWGNY